VLPADIARVRVGLPATVRLDPFDYTVYGSVQGEVTYVSADTLKENTPRGEEIYYRVHVRPQTPQQASLCSAAPAASSTSCPE
jgi:adhesin transport system membrane fusion protein